VASATYDAGNRVATWGGQIFSYDANGNLGSDGPTSYLWNVRDQLTRTGFKTVARGFSPAFAGLKACATYGFETGSSISGAAGASFAYDGDGRRRARTTNGTTNYLFDHVNTAQERVAGTPTANLLTGGIDEVFQRADGSGTRAVLSDVLGSTVALVDGSGAVQTQYTYEPFGATSTSGVVSTNPSQYTGRENDGTGLYYYRARYLHPQLQRFLSEDPIEFGAGDPNLRAYAFNTPTRYRDPSERLVVHLILCAAGALGSAGVDWMTGRKFNPVRAA
jgi:RHS repeat-associated protein